MRMPQFSAAVVNDAGEPITKDATCSECTTISGFIRATVYYSLVGVFVIGLCFGIGGVVFWAVKDQPDENVKNPLDSLELLIPEINNSPLDNIFSNFEAQLKNQADPYFRNSESQNSYSDPSEASMTASMNQVLGIYKSAIGKSVQQVTTEENTRKLDLSYLKRNFLTFRHSKNNFLVAIKPSYGEKIASKSSDTSLEVYIEVGNGDSHKLEFDWKGIPKQMTASLNGQLTQVKLDWKNDHSQNKMLQNCTLNSIVTDLRGIALERKEEGIINTQFLSNNIKIVRNLAETEILQAEAMANVLRLSGASGVGSSIMNFAGLMPKKCDEKIVMQALLCDGGYCKEPYKISGVSTVVNEKEPDSKGSQAGSIVEQMQGSLMFDDRCQFDSLKLGCDRENEHHIGPANVEMNIRPQELQELPGKIEQLYSRMDDILDYSA